MADWRRANATSLNGLLRTVVTPGKRSALLKGRRYGFDLERALYLTVLHRLFAHSSDRAAERWRESYLIPGTETLELHQL